jgi:hypothetical protein
VTESGAISAGAHVAADLMLRNPKTLTPDASVADVREQLANSKVQMVILAEGRAFRGAVTAIPDEASPTEFALTYTSTPTPRRSRPAHRPGRRSNAPPQAPTGG